MDHSIQSYLNRQSDAVLKIALRDCLQRDSDHYRDIAAIILEILEKTNVGAGYFITKQNHLIGSTFFLSGGYIIV